MDRNNGRDFLGRKIEVGDYVIVAQSSYKRPKMKVGKVLRITEMGNVSCKNGYDRFFVPPKRAAVISATFLDADLKEKIESR